MAGTSERLVRLLFPVSDDRWLAILRFGLGLQVIFYTVSLRKDWTYLFAGTGNNLTARDLGEVMVALKSPFIPRLGWLINSGASIGLSENVILNLVWGLLLLVGLGLLAGLYSRLMSVIAWFLHLAATESAQLFPYGMDSFMTIGLFYLMIAPFPDSYSLDRLIRKIPGKDLHLHGFFQRVLQVHLCFIYFFSGLAKCMGSGWWNGSNLWRALTRPPFDTISPSTLIQMRVALPVAGILVCIVEVTYPFFIWLKKTRPAWLVAILIMHMAIGLIMRMYLFAFVMIVLNLAAFGAEIVVPKRASRTEPCN